jgi:hypothetical protein
MKKIWAFKWWAMPTLPLRLSVWQSIAYYWVTQSTLHAVACFSLAVGRRYAIERAHFRTSVHPEIGKFVRDQGAQKI